MATGIFGTGWLRAVVVVSQCFASKTRPGNTVSETANQPPTERLSAANAPCVGRRSLHLREFCLRVGDGRTVVNLANTEPHTMPVPERVTRPNPRPAGARYAPYRCERPARAGPAMKLSARMGIDSWTAKSYQHPRCPRDDRVRALDSCRTQTVNADRDQLARINLIDSAFGS